jgi:hypothetical protein
MYIYMCVHVYIYMCISVQEQNHVHEGRQTKKGRRENAIDLDIVEWGIPVGRAERAGDREGC